MHFWTAIVGDEEAVGIGWFEPASARPAVSAWIYDIRVDGAGGGRVWGARLGRPPRRGPRARGDVEALNVFGDNTTAIRSTTPRTTPSPRSR